MKGRTDFIENFYKEDDLKQYEKTASAAVQTPGTKTFKKGTLVLHKSDK